MYGRRRDQYQTPSASTTNIGGRDVPTRYLVATHEAGHLVCLYALGESGRAYIRSIDGAWDGTCNQDRLPPDPVACAAYTLAGNIAEQAVFGGHVPDHARVDIQLARKAIDRLPADRRADAWRDAVALAERLIGDRVELVRLVAARLETQTVTTADVDRLAGHQRRGGSSRQTPRPVVSAATAAAMRDAGASEAQRTIDAAETWDDVRADLRRVDRRLLELGGRDLNQHELPALDYLRGQRDALATAIE